MPRLDLAAIRDRVRVVPSRYAAAVAFGLLLSIVISNVQLWDEVVDQGGTDFAFYLAHAQSWVDGRGFYDSHQLAGPYAILWGVGNMYPPPALLLFLPFIWLPHVLYWIVPLGIIGWIVWSFRPLPWTWPILAFLVWIPRSQSIVIWGNSAMWLVAIIALGVRFSWPSILVLMKPTFAPFAVVGIRRRSWWLALGVFVTVNVILLPLWDQYFSVWRNAGDSWPKPGYEVFDYLTACIPLVAWLGRRRGVGEALANEPEKRPLLVHA